MHSTRKTISCAVTAKIRWAMDGSVAEHDESHMFEINLLKNTLSTISQRARGKKIVTKEDAIEQKADVRDAWVTDCLSNFADN